MEYMTTYRSIADAMAQTGPTVRVPMMTPTTNCLDCIMHRIEGIYRCPVHYDPVEDNARALWQTGVGITN